MKRFLIGLLLVIPFMACNTKVDAKPKPYGEDSLNMENLIMVVWSLPFKHKDIVVAQAILETGWFKSNHCVNNNNLFGMKRCYARVTTSDTVIDGFAHYPSWKHSVIDYFILQSTRESIIPSNRDSYFHYLDKVYSEVGHSYSSQLRDILSRIDLPDDVEKQPKVTHHKSKHKKKKTHRR